MKARPLVTSSAFGLLVGAMAVVAFASAPVVLDVLRMIGDHVEIAGMAFGISWLLNSYRRTCSRRACAALGRNLPRARMVRG